MQQSQEVPWICFCHECTIKQEILLHIEVSIRAFVAIKILPETTETNTAVVIR